MARILITGANGFTGRHLVERLSCDGHELHAVVHASDGPHGQLCHARYEADLRNLEDLNAIVAKVRPQWVVHLAAIAFVAHDDAAELYSTNILGSRNLFHALSTASQQPDAVLFASSANIYGNQREGVLREDMPAAPANDYGVTKVAGEALAALYSDRLPIITARPFNYTGLGQSEKFLIPKIVAHARDRRPVIELGNIDVSRDFSDVRFVVDAYARLLATPAAIGGGFNVCSGQARSVREVIEFVEAESGHSLNVEINPDFVRYDEVNSLCGSGAKLESVIGSVPMPPLQETIAWMLHG